MRPLRQREGLAAAYARQAARCRLLMEHTADAILIVAADDGRLIELNNNAARFYGYRPEALVGLTLGDLLDEDLSEASICHKALYKTIDAAVNGDTAICQCRQRNAAGRSIPVQLRFVRLPESERGLLLVYVSEVLPALGNVPNRRPPRVRDALTGLVNRTLFIDRLGRAIDMARRHRASLAVLSVKIDRFKHLKGNLGNNDSERVLQQIARVLSDCVRAGDAVAHFGGPEFSILVEDVAERGDAERLAEKIRQAVGARLVMDGQNMFLTASIGVSTFPKDAQDGEGLLKAADDALARAKELGGNGYQFFSAGLRRRADEFFRLRSALHDAVERGEFVLHYQPKIEFGSGRMTGVEALIRWRHPERGLMLPEEFIHTAEASGLIVPIGAWALEAACHQLREWTALRAAVKLSPLRMAVNLSARQLGQPHLDLAIAKTLQSFAVDPGMLELEITESVVMDNPELALQTLNRIRARGVRIALDDFGTGYSSLNHLKKLPIDVVKIDRSFVTDVAVNKCDRAIVEAITGLAHALGMEVVAEGVETARQYLNLEQCGCDAAQGFLASCPLPAARFDFNSEFQPERN
jgi:diguanylate cyclase (GGDEF)-like protein/PAS domain S-box-containing protein